jgi:hypothetical protein
MDASIGATGEHQGLFAVLRVITSDVQEVENGSTRYKDVTSAGSLDPPSGSDHRLELVVVIGSVCCTKRQEPENAHFGMD